MQNPRLAERYAKSLLDLSVEQNSLDATLSDMQLMDSICNQNPDFCSMLRSPVIGGDKKRAVLTNVLGSRTGKLTQAFTNLLIGKGREASLPEIAGAFIAQYKTMKSIRTVKLTTAVQIDNSIKESIRRKVAAGMADSTIELNTEVNPDLIGGFVLEMDDKLFDASVRRDLNDIRSHFADNDYVAKLR